MARPANLPRYVVIAESTIRDCFGLDLWNFRKADRDRLILAACDAEPAGELAVEVAVFDLWHAIKKERLSKRK